MQSGSVTSSVGFARVADCLSAFFASRSRSLYVIVRPSVCRLSVTFVHPTQAIEIFGNVSTPCGTLAIRDLCIKIYGDRPRGTPSLGS